MRYVIECVEAPDGIPVDPCGTVEGVALVPVVVQVADDLDYTGVAALYSWALSSVLIAFVVGLTVGAIMRTIRAA